MARSISLFDITVGFYPWTTPRYAVFTSQQGAGPSAVCCFFWLRPRAFSVTGSLNGEEATTVQLKHAWILFRVSAPTRHQQLLASTAAAASLCFTQRCFDGQGRLDNL